MFGPQGRLFMYVELDEQHDFSLYQRSQMVIAAFLNISVKAAHRKTVSEQLVPCALQDYLQEICLGCLCNFQAV